MSAQDEQAINEYKTEFLEAARYGELSDLGLMHGHERLRSLIDFSALQEPSSGSSSLMLAAANGHLDCMQYLIEKVSVSVNHRNKNGNSALHWAALNGHADCASYLIANGADVMAVNAFGKTPFDEAMARDHKDCCELLVKEEVRLAHLEEDRLD